MKTLTKNQINQLFAFCEKHCVRYYDVQVELVDHLASDIEQQFVMNDNISFEVALQKVYAGFGVTGFGKYMSEKEKQIRKKISSEKRKIIVSLVTLPKAIPTIGCLLLLLYPFTSHQYGLVKPMAIGLSALSIMSMISFFVYWIWVKKKTKSEKKLWILENGMMNVGICLTIFNINLQTIVHLSQFDATGFQFWYCLMLILLNYFAIIVLVANHQQNKKLREYALKTYPEAFTI